MRESIYNIAGDNTVSCRLSASVWTDHTGFSPGSQSQRRVIHVSFSGPPIMSDVYPAAYREGLRLFNAEEFFECHDVLEDIWRETVGEEKLFYKALIHAAVALYHFGEGNMGGARKMCGSCCKYLEPYGPRHMGLDIEQFLRDFRHCFQELLDAKGDYPSVLTLQPDRIPKIELPNEP